MKYSKQLWLQLNISIELNYKFNSADSIKQFKVSALISAIIGLYEVAL